jgi:hypothetical protein
MKHTTDHMAAIKSGTITKTNVIGLRKILNASKRRYLGYSVSSTAPNYTPAEVDALENALERHKPRVTGELHASGLKLLQSPRYRKRLADVQAIIAKLDSFRLVRFDRIGNREENAVPVYKACAGRKSFTFRNIPWQSGGNGPEIVEA